MKLKRIGQFIIQILYSIRFGRRYNSARYAQLYDDLKSYEDSAGNMMKALQKVCDLRNATVVELGAGTGKITHQIAGIAAKVYAFDRSESMIDFAKSKAETLGIKNCLFQVADHRSIPLDEDVADVVIMGWTLNSLVAEYWDVGDWKPQVDAVLAEVNRVLRKDGLFVVIETANVLNELPWGEIWSPSRKAFLDYLESEHGFSKMYFPIDSDYQTYRELRKYARFWGGKRWYKEMRKKGTTVLVTCAGAWYKKAPLLIV